MPYPLPLTRTEAYLAYKAGVIQQPDLKPSLAVPRNGIDEWLAYWTGVSTTYPVKNVGKNLFDKNTCVKGALLADGTIDSVTYGDIRTSNYIPVTAGEKYTVSGTPGGWGVVGFYTSNKVFINRPYSASHVYKAPDGAGYARVVCTKGDLNTCQFEKGSTASGYEAYTSEPLILQEEEAYVAYLCGVINEYPEKCLRRVGAYLRYLISARWGRPDHPLNREELYLSLIKTQVIPSGDPSSDIVIDGTAKAPFQDVKMYGDTFQQTYTGKNLFNKDSANVLVAYIDSAVSVITTNSQNRLIWISCEPNTTYTVSRQRTSGGQKQLAYTTQEPAAGVQAYGKVNWAAGSTECSITTGEDARYIVVRIWQEVQDSDISLDNLLKLVQIEKSSSATSYEPYVGGQPSPSPDYPQPIKTVTGLQTVKVLGKNLLNITSPLREVTNAGLHITIADDGKITIDGTSTGAIWPDFIWGIQWNTVSHNSCKYYFPKALEAATFSIKIVSGTVTGTPAVSVMFNDDGGKNTSIRFGQPQAKTVTGVKGINRAYLTNIQPGVTFDNFQFYLQVESGTTETEVVPYSELNHEINLGKNLFNVEAIPYVAKRAYDSDGAELFWDYYTGTVKYQPVEPNTEYTFWNNKISNITYLCEYDENKNFIRRTVEATTFTTTATTRYLRWSIYVGAGQIPPTQTQLEAGSTATAYAPYFTPIELCKLGTYQDYIWKDGNDWKVHKAIKKSVFDQNSGWEKNKYGTNAYNVKTEDIFTAVAEIGVISPQFIAKSYNNRTDATDNIIFADSNDGMSIESRGITIRNTAWSDLTSFTTWITSNPVTAYYVLANPTDTTITDTTLIAQLEALKNGGAENGTTYIKVNATDPNLPGLLYVEAPKYE